MSKAHFMLDNSVKHLKTCFARGAAKTNTDCGLKEYDDDFLVIEKAWKEGAILITTDVKVVAKCRKFQKDHNTCLYGLLLLPDGKVPQERVLNDLRARRKTLRHPHYKNHVTWEHVRTANLFVNARVPSNPTLQELCDCKWEEDDQ
jgi:hypothetical protein